MVINLLIATHLKHYALWLLILRTASFYSKITMPCNFIEKSTRSTMLKIYTSGNVNTFEGCFWALLESPEKLLLNQSLVLYRLSWSDIVPLWMFILFNKRTYITEYLSIMATSVLLAICLNWSWLDKLWINVPFIPSFMNERTNCFAPGCWSLCS